RYLARRPSPVTVFPSSRQMKSLGSGCRRSGRLSSTLSKRAPSMAGSRPRRTVSTSGSSGIEEQGIENRNRPVSSKSLSPATSVPGPSCLTPAPWRAMVAPVKARPTTDTHFGFRQVPLADKQGLVDDVFQRVARRYDLMNDLMTAGLHRAWKDDLVTAINPP